MKQILIIIPARYGSSRLPGKPLAKIAGVEMVKRVAQIAEYVCNKKANCSYVIATDDERIISFCDNEGIPSASTSETCQSGTERCWDVVQQMEEKPEFIINLQGDNPLCPPWFLEQLINDWEADKEGQVFTPCVHLTWPELDRLRESKKTTPFSGTTVQIDKSGYALSFSKAILPVMRNEEKARTKLSKSYVRRHIGLYAYTFNALEQYFKLEEGQYEEPEGLEQMRFLENKIPVKMVEVDYQGRIGMSGVDSPEDIGRAEKIIAECGEFDFSVKGA